MAARAGLANLIKRLRGLTEAGTADYVLAGESYWSDDHLQVVLDLHRTDFVREPLRKDYSLAAANTPEYHDYYSSYHNLEESSSGTAVWDLEDGTGATLGTPNYTVNYEAGHIRVTPDTDGTAYYLTGRSYNLEAAAADVWERKAAHAAKGYGFSADGSTFNRQQVFEHCLKMAAQYRTRQGITVTRMFRDDVA